MLTVAVRHSAPLEMSIIGFVKKEPWYRRRPRRCVLRLVEVFWFYPLICSREYRRRGWKAGHYIARRNAARTCLPPPLVLTRQPTAPLAMVHVNKPLVLGAVSVVAVAALLFALSRSGDKSVRHFPTFKTAFLLVLLRHFGGVDGAFGLSAEQEGEEGGRRARGAQPAQGAAAQHPRDHLHADGPGRGALPTS